MDDGTPRIAARRNHRTASEGFSGSPSPAQVQATVAGWSDAGTALKDHTFGRGMGQKEQSTTSMLTEVVHGT